MKLLFNLEYRTSFGEQLALNIIEEGQQVESHAMSTLDGYHWTVEVSMKQKETSGQYMDYYYSVMRGDKEVRHEWLVEPHRLEFAAKKGVRYTIYDHWIDTPEDSFMYSSAFTDCVMSRERQLSAGTEYQARRLFRWQNTRVMSGWSASMPTCCPMW